MFERALEGERRLVTILFCDVKGSTALAERLDPEDWAEIMNAAFEYLTRPVLRYGGTVARLMGDAVLAFFGAPAAHEDDPQRAVLAGLEIVSGIQPFREQIRSEYGMDFNVRVGINTGVVVVGEMGSALAGEYTAMGDAANLAARMEQTAQPGTVQISADTYRLVSALFEVETLGGIEVKGRPEPVPAYRALRLKAHPSRQRGIPGLSAPLVGRGPEFESLRQALFDVSRTVDISSMVDKAGQLTNFGLRVLYKDELDKLYTKRELYGDALTEINHRLLVMSGFSGKDANGGVVIWPEPLPVSETDQALALKTDKELGIASLETIAAKRGYDWAKEQARIANDKQGETNIGAELLKAFTRGA